MGSCGTYGSVVKILRRGVLHAFARARSKEIEHAISRSAGHLGVVSDGDEKSQALSAYSDQTPKDFESVAAAVG